MSAVFQFVLKAVGTKLLKFLAMEAIEVIVKRTDNKLDDEFLAGAKRAMEKAGV